MGSALGRNSNAIRDEDQPQSRCPNAAIVAPKSRASSFGSHGRVPSGQSRQGAGLLRRSTSVKLERLTMQEGLAVCQSCRCEAGSSGSAGRGSLRATASVARRNGIHEPMMPEVAGLPLSATQREPKRLMVACEGRYFGCQPSNEILAFHRRLINSSFVRT